METMLVKREGHPDAVVRINAADFDPATETKFEPAAEATAETEATVKPRGKRAADSRQQTADSGQSVVR